MLFTVSGSLHAQAQQKKGKALLPVNPVTLAPDGRLAYQPDSVGNRLPDFSYAGYSAGEMPIPDVPVKITVPIISGDATQKIQYAIDYVATLSPDKNGIRGAVLLSKGTYHISGSLKIKASGIILRGMGMGKDGTILFAAGKDRATFIQISGKHDQVVAKPVQISDAYVPVNSMKINVSSAASFKAGDQISIQRPSTLEWIRAVEMEKFGGDNTWLGWKPGFKDISWDRTITKINGNTITLDAPLTTALETRFGGGTLSGYSWPGRIRQVGVENLRCVSEYDTNNPKDEAHRWMAITMANIQDAWVRQVVFEHFAGSAVLLTETAKRITVEDCKSLSPVSEIGGQRRNTFLTMGQQTLFQRIYAEYGVHDFSTGHCAAGPNVFVQCESYLPFGPSGTMASWASGVLLDNVKVDGEALGFANFGPQRQGVGWTAANSMIWNCTASRLDNYKPPGANNWAKGTWARYAGNGDWFESDGFTNPRSLYYAQLADRLGEKVLQRAQLLPIEGDASSRPSAEVAEKLTILADQPAQTLSDWISSRPGKHQIPVNPAGVKSVDQLAATSGKKAGKHEPMHLQNGWLLRGEKIITGKVNDITWWRGDVTPAGLKSATPHITRYVPGRTGTGLTDDLEEVTDWMLKNNVAAIDHHYGLWYDRRRDDHQRVRRMTGDVWPPFYELPFARSGKETAWDGLSKYDLTQYNYWYWKRLKDFVDLADEKGLLLIHQNYFQHNILEAGAHYADFPWRPANNINHTPFPEPPNYAGDKRIFMAKNFYDISKPDYRALHKAYIRQCLDNFAGNTGVIQMLSAEYTGPLHFVQFWIDVIAEWEAEKGLNALVALSTTKDVQDAILADAARSSVVDIIDIRYWSYNADGKTAKGPEGGKNLAPRQSKSRTWDIDPQNQNTGNDPINPVYQAVKDYRLRFPAKAVMYSSGRAGWEVFMAGGSLASVPAPEDVNFFKAAATMKPAELPDATYGKWMLSEQGKGYIVFTDAQEHLLLDLSKENGSFQVKWFDPLTGKASGKALKVKAGGITKLSVPGSSKQIVWINK
ncbi:MAG: pectate lyase [Pedobacter sp.]|nr:MAG: pectate lyase [Pedobacter sp.]